MTRVSEIIQQHAAEPGPVIKIVNAVAAGLGISSFLGMVNLLVGVMSVAWLILQGYGYVKYELPMKREKLRRLKEGLTVNSTQPGDLR
jgi:uncharacterized membrane protein (Fun14 family)